MRGFEESACELNMPLKVLRDTFTGGREAYGQKLILVRPDQYVVWNGNDAPADTRAVMARAAGS